MNIELINRLFSISNECAEKLKTLIDNYIKSDGRLSEKIKKIIGLNR